MTKEEIEQLKGLAASMGLYDDRKPCKRAVILGKAIKALEQEPCEDCISRQAAIEAVKQAIYNHDSAIMRLTELPSVTPEKTTITYKDCSEAMLKMWIDNVLTDGQYNKIMDKLNAKHTEDMRGGKE